MLSADIMLQVRQFLDAREMCRFAATSHGNLMHRHECALLFILSKQRMRAAFCALHRRRVSFADRPILLFA